MVGVAFEPRRGGAERNAAERVVIDLAGVRGDERRDRGEPAAGDFCDNSIKTYKYNPISWLPKSLFEQMRRLANQFFLVMGILMAIGTLKPELFVSPINPGTTLGRVLAGVVVSMPKKNGSA